MILLFQTFNSMGYAGFIKMGVIPSTVEKVFFLWGGSSIKPYYYPYLPICYLIFRKNLQVVWGQRVFGASQLALVVKNPPINAGDLRDEGLISGSGRSPGGGHGNPLQYPCLKNPMDRSLAGSCPWGRKAPDTTEQAHHIYVICIYVILATYIPYPWRRKGQLTPVFLPGKSHG